MVHTILRRGYTFRRKSRNIRVPGTPTRRGHIRHISGKMIHVSPSRIRNRGLSGKGPYTLPPLSPGKLYGWTVAASPRMRHHALNKAIHHNSALTVFRRLQVLARYLKRTSPRGHRVALQNAGWVRRKF